MTSGAYLREALAGLQRLQDTALPALEQAAETMADAVAGGRCLFSFGASHSFILTEELVYRTGGLMLLNPIYPQGMNLLVRPITLTSQLERLPDLGRVLLESSPAGPGDVLLISSTSGRNAVTIDMALAARERQVTTIAITSLAYAEGVPSRHPSGKHLHELCDQVIDNCSPLGDAAVAIPGLEQRTGPLSTVLGCAVANELAAQVIALLVERGLEPPVFVSANLPGGDEHNQRLLAENRDRIFYL
ncbi:MAG TPA: SIS domain-containing protein [Armatimonadota bacterium]|jgi:uncharacterized phosphosugar-binding protein